MASINFEFRFPVRKKKKENLPFEGQRREYREEFGSRPIWAVVVDGMRVVKRPLAMVVRAPPKRTQRDVVSCLVD